MEEWKNCFEKYEISNLGNLRKNGKLVNGSIQNRGYRYFQINRKKKRTNYLFHHLVAYAFIGERPIGLSIDHIDRNKLNNNVNNLRYISHTENMRNTDNYRTDILSTDKLVRKRFFQKEHDIKRGHNRNLRRKRGTGSITKRGENSYRAIITINKIKYNKTFKTTEEAEKYLKDLN